MATPYCPRIQPPWREAGPGGVGSACDGAISPVHPRGCSDGLGDPVVCENSAEQALREAAPVARPADARCAGLRRAPRQPSASASVAD